MNVWDIVLIVILVLLAANAVRLIIKRKSSGGCSCGCGGCSGNCATCGSKCKKNRKQ